MTFFEGNCPHALVAADPALTLRLADGTLAAVPLTGSYNFPNLAAAAAVGLHFDIFAAVVAAALAQYNPQNNRSPVLRTANGNEVVLDAYNANPNSMAAALGSFAQRPCAPGPAKLVVLGDMFELGDDSPAEHRQVGQLLVQDPLLPAVLVGPDMAEAAAVARHAQYCATKAEAAAWLRQHPVLKRQVLVKGSRGMALETLVELL